MKRVLMLVSTSLFVVMGLALAGESGALEFEIRPGEPANVVRFESSAPIESFTGETKEVQGRIVLDPSDVGDSVTVSVEVDLASLDTGIKLRNQHMRENHLETDTYPTALFQGTRISQPASSALESGSTVTYEIEGRLSLHGVSRKVGAAVGVTLLESGDLHVVAHFVVNLSDFDINRPKFLFMKLGEEQAVTVDVIAIRKGK